MTNNDVLDDLFGFDDAEPAHVETLEERARRWLVENPQVADLFRRFARELLATRRRFGWKLVAERVRWETYVAHAEPLKVCNTFVAYIGRALAEEMPELNELVTYRRTPAAHLPYRPPSINPPIDREAAG